MTLEGWRASDTPGALTYDARAATTPVYRQANIGRLRLLLGAQHWDPPQITGRWCVQPDDVVLNKLAPIRAAFVSANAKRHPVDGNSLIVRGLALPQAAWVAFCLNQPEYEQLLLIESGVLQRVGIGALASLRMPPAPPQMNLLSSHLRDALDEQALTIEAVHRVRVEVHEATSAALPKARPLGDGAFYAPDAVSHDTWLPSATALRAEQAALDEELGWVVIGDLASSDDRARLGHDPEGARALRLRDVGDDLLVPEDDDGSEHLIPSRTLAAALIPGEVLLSTLGKLHPDYVVTDDAGEHHAIFDKNAHLRLEQPGNYEAVLSLIQDLGPVTDNQGNVVKKQGTLADIAADVLGRAFDAFLRANFESNGGLGIYLTPAPVKQAMLALAFHDIKQSTEDAARLVARDGKGRPAFRFCDPAYGSGGFLSVTLSHLRRTLDELGGKATATDEARKKLFAEMCENSFVGADSSPQMVMLARVNMALLGAPKARIFCTRNSLTSPQLEPAGFDLICTNPPFGTPKFNKGQEEAKKAQEAAMAEILEVFRSDLTPRNGRAGGFDYSPTVTGRAMGGQANGKGIWKEASPNTDPAVLFIDRCLQLLKSGGRPLIVLPDGVLCNSGDRYVREYIMGTKDEATGEFHGGKAIVKGVISLPADAFKLSGTGAKTSVLYLQKRHVRKDDPEKLQDEPQTDVFMAVAETLGYVVKNNVEDYSAGVPNDLAAIVGAYVRGE